LPATSLPAQVDDIFQVDSDYKAKKLHANRTHGQTNISV